MSTSVVGRWDVVDAYSSSPRFPAMFPKPPQMLPMHCGHVSPSFLLASALQKCNCSLAKADNLPKL
jgi:hypothetical protein